MYNKRKWINSEKISSTGSIVCFSISSAWLDENGKPTISRFVEVSDCHSKIRIHQSHVETKKEFIKKN